MPRGARGTPATAFWGETGGGGGGGTGEEDPSVAAPAPLSEDEEEREARERLFSGGEADFGRAGGSVGVAVAGGGGAGRHYGMSAPTASKGGASRPRDDVHLRSYVSQAARALRDNLVAVALLQVSWVALMALLTLACIVVLSVVEVMGGPAEEAPGPTSLGGALDLEAELAHGDLYYLAVDYLMDFTFSVVFVYPALASFFYATFAALRRGAAAGDEGIALHFNECFVCFPTSARRSYPLAAGCLLFAGRMAFTLLDYIMVSVWLASASPTAALVGKAAVWVPYLYYSAMSCFVLAYHVERPNMSAWWGVQESVGLTLLYAGPLFWHILFAIVVLVAGLLFFVAGVLVALPVVLFSVAFMFEGVVGVTSPGHEEPHAYMGRRSARHDDDGL